MKLALQITFLCVAVTGAFAQEAVMEEVRVEGVSPLELSNDRQVDLFTRRLLEHNESKHALELQLANQNPLTTLLNLTSHSPIPLGSSENRVDTFFLQNYMRGDLNPKNENPLFSTRPDGKFR